MLNEQEINEEIAALENKRNHSATDCANLANLYSIRDHAFRRTELDQHISAYSQASAPIATSVLDNYGDSDFLLVVSGKVPADAWGIMDDLMDTLRVVNPRVYESVMRKMRSL